MKPDEPILLVEDDEIDAMTVKRCFKQLGVRNPLYHKSDGESALEFLRDPTTPQPGVIILDLNMPRMNGLEFMQNLQRDPRLAHTPVVVLTASREDEDRLASARECISGYMVKPVEFPEFVQVMKVIHQYWTTCESLH